MKNFNEWLSHRTEDYSDTELVTNQLSQFVDRVAGILHDLSEEKKAELVDKFVEDLKKRLND